MSALPQTNAYLTKVEGAPVLADSFVDYGSGDGPEAGATKWSGMIGCYLAPTSTRRESGTDGRDVVSQKSLYIPGICLPEIGDLCSVLVRDVEIVLKVVEIKLHGLGVEPSPYYELSIEEA